METDQQCNITILETDVSYVWVRGVSEPYAFEAKVYCEGSKFGIRNGRISKFAVWTEANEGRRWIANYDRGWDIQPQEEHKQFVEHIIGLLEAMSQPEDLKKNMCFSLD